MYEKNLKEDLRLRLSTKDMDFLRELSQERSCSVSEVIRSIIGEYRRSLETIKVLQDAIRLGAGREVAVQNGDTETDIHDKL